MSFIVKRHHAFLKCEAMSSNVQHSIGLVLVWFLVIALRPQTLKHIRGGWSHNTDTSKRVHGNGAQNMVTVQSGFEPTTFRSLAHELTNYFNRAQHWQVGGLLMFIKQPFLTFFFFRLIKVIGIRPKR
jgi:hypothetical protein